MFERFYVGKNRRARLLETRQFDRIILRCLDFEAVLKGAKLRKTPR
jgi:hypothetical protein